MKKVICILILTVIMFSAFAMCSEASAFLTAEFKYYPMENAFVVYGTSDDEKSGDEITVEMYLNGDLIDVSSVETELNNGVMTYESEMMTVAPFRPGGKIMFKVYSAHGGNIAQTSEFDYYAADTLYPALKNISAALNNNDYETFISIVSDNSEGLKVDIDTATSLSENAAKVMKRYICRISLTLPADIDNEENIKIVFEQLAKFRKEFEYMTMLGEFADCSVKTKFISWYEKYKNILNLEEYSEKLYSYFADNYTNSGYFEILSKESKAFESIKALSDRLLEAGGLFAVKNGNTVSVQAVFNDFSEMIKIKYELSDIQKTVAYGKLPNQEFSSFEKLAEKYNAIAYEILHAKETNSSPSGSGIKVSSGTSRPSENKPAENKPPYTETKKDVFKDMDEAKWALEAVEYLYEKGIVSGKTENTFMPNADITRGEFIKLLVCLKNGKTYTEEQFFSDVTKEHWAFGYINEAYRMNIINGYANGTFCPDDKMTRQDMAVMLYRMLDIGEKSDLSNLSEFSDSNSISEYAAEAVSYFYMKKMLNGMGNGTFSPNAFATRAQAAQIIYNIIKS